MAQRFGRGSVAEWNSLANLLTSVNGFVDVGMWECPNIRTKMFAFTGATNTLNVKILGSIDGGVTFPFEEVASFPVTAGATVTKTFTTFYSHVKVQVQPAVAATHGTLSTTFGGASW